MMTLIYNYRLKRKKEEGQSMLEFVLVLPVFALMLFMILDYGWLFYNYINVENSARNAARIACVEYQYVCLDEHANLESPHTYHIDELEDEEVNDQVKDILSQVKGSLPDPDKIQSVTVEYSYDNSTSHTSTEKTANDRYKGDVTVTVKYQIPVFTPILGASSDHMKKTITSTSTFKVEKSDNN